MVASAIFTGLLLFLPKNILMIMNLDELPILWNRIIGIVFLLSVALISTMMFFSVIAQVASYRSNKKIRVDLKKRYQTLSTRQKSIILQVLRSEDKTITLDKNSGDTIYLVNNLFLHMPQKVFSLGWNDEIMLKYVPQPWLLDLYNQEPEMFS